MTLEEVIEPVEIFMESGGEVLTILFAVTMLLWTLIFERMMYQRLAHPRFAERQIARWSQRTDRDSWYARQIRRQMIAEVAERLHATIPMINTLVTICPLLGLLGTVLGMLQVFDMMSLVGNSDPRAMAHGVSMATISTMAGMVAALSGVYFAAQLKSSADAETRRFSARLVA